MADKKTRRKVAQTLGLMRHEWVLDDPENSDVWCRFCQQQQYRRVTTTNCREKPVPSTPYLRKRVESEIKKRRLLLSVAEQLGRDLGDQPSSTEEPSEDPELDALLDTTTAAKS